jgi:DMSO/TMAO reductase YedYZ molybdopterin-dependent catalytic subunit
MKNPDQKHQEESPVEQKIRRRNFISLTTLFVMGAAAYKGWDWLYHAPPETSGLTARARKPLRAAMNKTALFFRNFFSNGHLVKTYPKSMAAKRVRVNSNIGNEDKHFDPENWQLSVSKHNGEVLKVSLADIKALPKTEIVFDFKCVEGWDQIQHWAGLRFIDFIRHYDLDDQTAMQYVGMETPDGKYQVGLDMESALHPQTILAYEMNEAPLQTVHGAPLRLIIPVKYGIKNIKCIGSISFSDQQPPDYWAKRGYDYYSGL